MSTGKVTGVETNEFSRFVDHTLATPWETLISDIEKALRLLMQRRQSRGVDKTAETASSASTVVPDHHFVSTETTPNHTNQNSIIIHFQNIDFCIEEFSFQENQFRYNYYHSIENNWITTKLKIQEFVLFYPNIVRGSEYDSAMFTTVSSAFSIAVKSLPNVLLPMFCTISLIKLSEENSVTRRLDFALMEQVIGYQYANLSRLWIRYDCNSYDKLSRKHPLYFYDGIRKLYQKKIRVLGLDKVTIGPHSNTSNKENMLEDFTSSISHYFEFDATTWLSMSIPFQPKNTSSYTTEYVLHQIAQLLQRQGEVASSHLLHTQNQKLLLDKVKVAIEFHELKQHSIIDNETYSTFLTSRQAPMYWKLSSVFHPVPYTTTTSTVTVPTPTSSPSLMEEVDVLCHSIWKAKCIQKLLSFFLLVYYISNNHNIMYRESLTMESRFLYEKYFDETSLEELRQLTTFFSSSFQQSFFTNMFPDDFLLRFPTFAGTQSHLASKNNTAVQNTNNASSRQSSSSSAPAPNNSLRGQGSPVVSRSKSLTPTISVASEENNNTGILNTSNITAAEDAMEEAENTWIESLVTTLFAREEATIATSQSSNNNKVNGSNTGTQQKEATSTKGDFASKWFEFFSIFVGLQSEIKGSGIMKLWQACMREFQSIFDDDRAVSWSQIHGDSDVSKTVSSCKEKGYPIFCQPLWDDTIQKKVQDGIPVNYPNISSSMMIQKLQMIQFCIVMKGENTIYNFTKNTSVVNDEVVYNPRLFKRLPITEDVLAVHKHVYKKFQGEGNAKALKDNPLLPFQMRYPSLLTDINAFKAANPHADLEVFCHWYGILDDFTNASSSAKHCFDYNSQAEEEVEEADRVLLMEKLVELWRDIGCGKSCDEQKPLFHAEKELGKAIAFIDRTQSVNFAADMLLQGINWIMSSFEHVIGKYLFSYNDNGSSKDFVGIKVLDDRMHHLKDLVEKASKIVRVMNAPKPSSNTIFSSLNTPSSSPIPPDSSKISSDPSNLSPLPNSNPATPLNLANDMTLFQLFDQIYSCVEEVEVMLCKMIQVNPIVHTMHDLDDSRKAMLTSWITEDKESIEAIYTLSSEDEVKSLKSLIKSIHHRNGKGHEWYSYDGRELGLPHSKDFILKSYRKAAIPPLSGSNTSDNSNTISRSSTELTLSSPHTADDNTPTSTTAIKLDFVDDHSPISSGKFVVSDEAENKEIHEFEFRAFTDGTHIRSVSMLAERD